MTDYKTGYYIREPKFQLIGDCLYLDLKEMEFVYLHQLNLPIYERELSGPHPIFLANITDEFKDLLVDKDYISENGIDHKRFNENNHSILDRLFWVKVYSSEQPELGEEWFFLNDISIWPYKNYEEFLCEGSEQNGDYLVNLHLSEQGCNGGYYTEFTRFDYNPSKNKYEDSKETAKYSYRLKQDFEWPELSADEWVAIESLGWGWNCAGRGVENGKDLWIALKREYADIEHTYALDQLAKRYPEKFKAEYQCAPSAASKTKRLAPSDPDNYNFSFKFTIFDYVEFGEVADGHLKADVDLKYHAMTKRDEVKAKEEVRNKAVAKTDQKFSSCLFWIILLAISIFIAIKCS